MTLLFSNTYQEIEAEANKIWKFDKYNLVFSFYFKPLLPPPLIIISHMMDSVLFVYRKCLERSRASQDTAAPTGLAGFYAKYLKPSKPKRGFGKNIHTLTSYILVV